jgi:Mg2+/Co2+ transporter CorB
MVALLAVALVSVTVSCVCSLLEATLYSAQPAALEAARARGGRRGKAAARLLELKADVSAPTSAILILNTIANTAGATLVGVLAVRELGSSALTPISIVLTIAILFLAEIIPKTYAASHWRRLWPTASWMLALLVSILSPAIRVVDLVTGALTRQPRDNRVPRDEIQAMVRMGHQSGTLDSAEAELLDTTLELGQRPLGEVTIRAMLAAQAEMNSAEASEISRNVVQIIEISNDRRIPTVKDTGSPR